MVKFLTGQDIVNTIRTLLDKTDCADLAVAYWGKDAIKMLGLKESGAKVRILCDPWSGACNPTEMTKLLGRHNTEVMAIRGLHAKVYLTPKAAVIGSANASINGLGEEGKETDEHEAAVWVDDQTAVQTANKWFQERWAKCDPQSDRLSPDMLKRIKPIWRWKRNNSGLLSVLRRYPEQFDGLPIWLVVINDQIIDQQYRDVWNKVHSRWWTDEIKNNGYGPNTNGYCYPFLVDDSGWHFKPGGYFVNYWAEKDAKSVSRTDDGGVWRVKGVETINTGNKKKRRVILLDAVDEVLGFGFSNSDYKELQSHVNEYLNKNPAKKSQHVLVDVQLGNLPSDCKNIYTSLVKSRPGR